MSELQKYTFELDFYGHHVVRTDSDGYTGAYDHAEYCRAPDVDARLAADRATIADLQAKCAELHERLARSDAGNKALREAIERLRSAGYLGNRWPTYLDSALAVADGQPHPDDADEAVFTAQEERIAELEASLDNVRSQLTALRLNAASDPELRPAFDGVDWVDDRCLTGDEE